MGGLVVVTPGGLGGHGHEDGFGAAAGDEPESGPPVIEEIEFDVASAADSLKLFLGLAEGKGRAAVEYAEIGVAESLGRPQAEIEGRLETEFVEIVEKNTADAPLFSPVGKVEITVAFAFQASV